MRIGLWLVAGAFGWLAGSASPALAQAHGKNGARGCPSGYHSDNNYCVASSKNAKPIIRKSGGSCPSGWHSDGDWCVKS